MDPGGSGRSVTLQVNLPSRRSLSLSLATTTTSIVQARLFIILSSMPALSHRCKQSQANTAYPELSFAAVSDHAISSYAYAIDVSMKYRGPQTIAHACGDDKDVKRDEHSRREVALL